MASRFIIPQTTKCAGVEISPFCSNRCVFCNPKGISTKASNIEIKKQEVNMLKSLLEHKKRGYRSIEISGHDPLEYPFIAPLIKYAKKIGFLYVYLSTNGVRLADRALLNKIIESGVYCLRVPLYGSNAKIHNSVTQVKNSFKNTVKGLKQIKNKAPKIKLWLTSLILKQNKNDINRIIALVKYLKPDHFNLSIPCVSNKNYSYYIPFKNLQNIVKKVMRFSLSIDYPIEFTDIPYCVFGFYSPFIKVSMPPNLGSYNQPHKHFKSKIPNIPNYRLKTKTMICRQCKLSIRCSGFYVNDIKKYGFGNLKPIKYSIEESSQGK